MNACTDSGDKPDTTSSGLHPLTSVVLTVLVVIGLLLGALFYILTFVFFGNFHLPNMWHLFVLAYTLAMPPMSLVGLIAYHILPSRATACISLLFAIGSLAIWLLWSAEASRGLIH